ncbi:Pentatricopeptide repeat-containing protein [Abeliophyllum distichum]|uniref:Pentatricopeptide repeat-containing protein n=1 Tax=Abeliophyllum distichum TaxID=126358 RepID=A0ABD1QGL0_9LAMI
MKLFYISTYPQSFYQKIQKQFFSKTSTRTRYSKKGSKSDSLYKRISPLGDPNVSVEPVLQQWIREGNTVNKTLLQNIINELRVYKRFRHALEVSHWMTDKRHFRTSHFDAAVRLKLIFKVYGLEQAEKFFNEIPENLKTFEVYLALLTCYANARSVDKAEAIMQKAIDLGYASKPLWYNLMMNLHYQLGNWEKLDDLMNEMEAKGIDHDHFTLAVRLSAYAAASDPDGIDKTLRIFESDPHIFLDWKTYLIAAEGYLRLGLVDKALAILQKLEGQLAITKNKNILFFFLLKLYGETGRKDELYRIWILYKQSGKVINKVYISMMRSLMKFNDIEGVEKIFEEWGSSGLSYDFRISNFLIDAYCRNGLLTKAEALINSGLSKGGDPLVITWCHLAAGYLKENQVPKAVEALRKAIAISFAESKPSKDSLTACLDYLDSSKYLEKVEEFTRLLRIENISSGAIFDQLSYFIKDGTLQPLPQDKRNCEFVTEDE